MPRSGSRAEAANTWRSPHARTTVDRVSPTNEQATESEDRQERVNDELAQEIVDIEARPTTLIRTQAETLGKRITDL